MHRIPCYLAALMGALFMLPTTTAMAQLRYDAPNEAVEILGLRSWTLDMLRDSVRKYVPGQELHDAACMVTLRDSLGFADAYVQHFMNWPQRDGSKRTHLLIKLVEPQDAGRVQWRQRPGRDRTSLIPEFASVVLPITDSAGNISVGRFVNWLQERDSADRQRRLDATPERWRADGERVYAFLDAQGEPVTLPRYLRILERDGFWVNRMIAAAVVGNYSRSDSAWVGLVRALRDADESVRGAALMTLRAMPPRPVDWSPVADDLRLLLGGTNIAGMSSVMQLLSRTHVSPALARALLRGNGDWMLEHLNATSPMEAGTAHALLVRLNGGVDLGSQREPWERWVRSL